MTESCGLGYLTHEQLASNKHWVTLRIVKIILMRNEIY